MDLIWLMLFVSSLLSDGRQNKLILIMSVEQQYFEDIKRAVKRREKYIVEKNSRI